MTLIQSPANAPAAIGPYSQAVRTGNLVFCSGQLPSDPATGNLVEGDMGVLARQSLANVAAVLKAAGATMADVVKCTVFMTDLSEFPAMNAAYATAFGTHKPARSTVQVAALPKGARVEIEAIAVVEPETGS
jgi:2-iminobutanoate/2-iminopropanoate deaminase